MHPHALIDGREVVQHLVGLVDLFLEKAQKRGQKILRHPKRGNTVIRLLGYGYGTKFVPDFFCDCRGGDHTSSVSRRVVIFCREGCNRSRIEGIGARVVSCGPTTQLNGRRSVPTACRNNSSPSRNASGRGGQPGTQTSTGRNLSTPCTTL